VSTPSAQVRRAIAYVQEPPEGHWVGDGFAVRTYLSYAEDAERFSPFLLLDYGAPRQFPPTRERLGVGPHPHRGFETVTIAFQGEVEHRDSAGNSGRIGPGDVQWMTAGGGVLHEEFHGRDFAAKGGPFEMAQIWVDLPRKDKRTAPRYQDLAAASFPSVALPDGAGQVRVISGTCLGATGPAHTFSPVSLWDLHLVPGGAATLDLPAGQTLILLVRSGPIVVNEGPTVPRAHFVLFERDGSSFHLAAHPEATTGADVLILGGAPLHQPVVGHGPFVMSTWDEILEATDDLKRGRFGTL
jgi:redox-sensitive bicupin YhaK (pirin superfamily)